jgi:hypothetical protein
MGNVSDEVVEKIKTHFTFNKVFFFENSVLHEQMWKNIVEIGRPRMIIWHMCIA